MTEKQKEDALSFAQKLAKESDDKTIDEAISKVDKFKSNKTIKKIWDHVLILIEVIKSPLFHRTISFGAIAAILYLVSPIDIIPDVIVGVGLLDDAFIISTMLAGVVKNIKNDPIKAIRFIDSLPPYLKDLGIETLILGNRGQGAIDAIAASGLKEMPGITGNADNAAELFAKGELKPNFTAKCSHHGEHNNDHHNKILTK